MFLQDFMVVHLCPPHPSTSPLLEHQFAQAVRFVTDPYRDAPEHPGNN